MMHNVKYAHAIVFLSLMGILNCVMAVLIAYAGYNPYPLLWVSILIALVNTIIRWIDKRGHTQKVQSN